MWHETINKRVRDIRYLLEQTGQTIHPAKHHLSHLDDLAHRASNSITVPNNATDKFMICTPYLHSL